MAIESMRLTGVLLSGDGRPEHAAGGAIRHGSGQRRVGLEQKAMTVWLKQRRDDRCELW
jgi:hypothetical protein